MASASLRLHCAELAAQQQTGAGYLEAIAIVNALPPDHPLRPRINQSIEDWAGNMLVLGDRLFDEGKLQEAIATAQKIPTNTTAAALVANRIALWRNVWEKAEKIYQETEQLIRQREWTQAFRQSTRLLAIDNPYWTEVKYQELTQLIQTARVDGEALTKAEDLAEWGTVAELLKAISQAEKVKKSSYLYGEAQNLIRKFGRKIIRLAEENLEKGEGYQEAIAIVPKIPPSAQLTKEVEDFIVLAKAYQLAGSDTISGLEAAIAQAQQIDIKRPLYGKAQYLISRWQREIEDVARLEKARNLARGGSVEDLARAVAEISLIPPNNPRYNEATALLDSWNGEIQTIQDRPYLNRAESLALGGDLKDLRSAISEASAIVPGRSLYGEAQEKMSRWQAQIERIEDRPYLDNAQSLAFGGDVLSLRAAINEAQRISPGRALYPQAEEKIQLWTEQLQRLEDLPYLDQARNYANQGDLSRAIATAGQVASGRALSGEANGLIQDWRWQLRAQESLQDAQQIAARGTPEDLAAAINRAEQVPSEHPLRPNAEQQIATWGQQLLSLAQARANYDLPGAIAIAGKIPAYHSLYSTAQSQIATWQSRVLAPPASPSVPPPPVPGLEVLPISTPN